MAAHAHLKNDFTEDEKCHNLMSWLVCCSLAFDKDKTNTVTHSAFYQDFKTDDHYGTQSPKSILTTSVKREYDELLTIIQEVTPEMTLPQMKCILRDFKNATFYVDCFLYWVDLMLHNRQ